jgi:hypothetical protein
LGLAGIQSAYGEAAEALCRPAPTANAVIPALVTAARLRKSRRDTPRRVVWRGLGVAEEIAELVLGVAPSPADRDPLLLPLPGTRGRIHLAEVEDDAPAAFVALH